MSDIDEFDEVVGTESIPQTMAELVGRPNTLENRIHAARIMKEWVESITSVQPLSASTGKILNDT